MGVHRNKKIRILKKGLNSIINGGTHEITISSKNYTVPMGVHRKDGDESSRKINIHFSPQNEKFLYNNTVEATVKQKCTYIFTYMREWNITITIFVVNY